MKTKELKAVILKYYAWFMTGFFIILYLVLNLLQDPSNKIKLLEMGIDLSSSGFTASIIYMLLDLAKRKIDSLANDPLSGVEYSRYLDKVCYLKNKNIHKCPELQQWGVVQISDNRRTLENHPDSSTNYKKVIEQTENNLDIIGFGLSNFRDNNKPEDILERIHNHKSLKIRIIAPSIDNMFIKYQDNFEIEQVFSEHSDDDSTKKSIINLQKWYEKLSTDALLIDRANHIIPGSNKEGKKKKLIEELRKRVKEQVEIRYHYELPLYYYMRMDNKVFVGPYEKGKKSKDTITFEFEHESKSSIYFSEYFERVWKLLEKSNN